MVLSLASLNLHCGLDHRGAPYSVKAAVAALDTDVIVVQENWRARGTESLAASAAADCGYPCFAELDMVPDAPLADLDVVDGAAPDEVGAWGLAVMSRVPWVSTTAIGIGTAPGDVVGARSAQVIELPGLRVVNVHLTHRLLHGLGTAATPARGPALVAGAHADRRGPEHVLSRRSTWPAGTGRAVRGRTWPAQRPVAQLDHVLLGAGVMATGAEVGPNLGSDHLPVRLTIQ
nr:hypothetical protein GCM10020092_032570 [Actinoplanes digitatis]